jgi:hypothetical protein
MYKFVVPKKKKIYFIQFFGIELVELIDYVGLFRFELKYFDPFLVLDEFSGEIENLCFLLCFLS